MPAISQLWTAGQFWREAVFGKKYDPNQAVHEMRFEIQKRVDTSIVSTFYDLVGQFYMREHTIQPDTVGKKTVSGTGTWTAATRTLVFSGMNVGFTSADLGKTAVITIGIGIFSGQVYRVVSSTTLVMLASPNLPTTDGTVDDVRLLATALTSGSVYIGNLRIARTGTQIKSFLTSTETVNVIAADISEITKFRSGAPQNQDKILWTILGDRFIEAKGDGLATFGTQTLYYPGLPNEIQDDDEMKDIVDGALMEICTLQTRKIVYGMIGEPISDFEGEMQGYIQGLYRSVGQTASTQVIQEKVSSLK
jgi:hypothetical protein